MSRSPKSMAVCVAVPPLFKEMINMCTIEPAARNPPHDVSRCLTLVLSPPPTPQVAAACSDVQTLVDCRACAPRARHLHSLHMSINSPRRAGTVRLELLGACGSCASSTMTMKMGLERGLREKIPEILDVEQVSNALQCSSREHQPRSIPPCATQSPVYSI